LLETARVSKGFDRKPTGHGLKGSQTKIALQIDRRLYAQVTWETAMLETERYECPYCGEESEAVLDLSGGDQTYIEDCPVCCRPITFVLQTDGHEWLLEVHSENE
jgi:hypothetical protein